MSNFQKSINRDVPRGVAGDFASTNPRTVMLAGEGALRAAEPITVGYFAFADLETGSVYADLATGLRIGFVHRNNQAVVMASGASMTVPTGKETALFTEGDFYTILDAACDVGDAVYAEVTGGAPTLTNGPAVGDDPATTVATSFVAAEKRAVGELVKITTNAI